MPGKQRITTLIGLFIAVVLPVVGLTRFLPAIPGADPTFGREWFWWALGAFMVLYVLVVERRPLSSIGLKRPTWKTLAFGVLGAAITIAGMVAIYTVVFPILHLKANTAEMHRVLATSVGFRILLVTRAAVMEEMLFRGYGIERLQELTGSPWLAGLVTFALFTAGHLAVWGWSQLLIAGMGGLVLTLLYFWRRDLLCNMAAHWITDAVGLLVPHG